MSNASLGKLFPRPLRLFIALFVAYSVVTWIACLIHYKRGDSQAYSSPFIHKSIDPFTDGRTYIIRFHRYLHKDQFFQHFADQDLPYFSYPAPAAAVYRIMYVTPWMTKNYLLLGFAWSCFLAWILYSRLVAHGSRPLAAGGLAVLMLLGAFPIDFMLERGNIELFVWILIFSGLFLYLLRYPRSAGVLLGVAASIKIFPIIFCGILLHGRKYGALAIALLTAVLSDVLSLWWAGPTFMKAFHGFNGTVTNYQHSYSAVARAADVGMDHSLYALVKVMGEHSGLAYQNWLHPYYVIAGLLALLLFFTRVLRLPLWNQLLFIAAMAVLLPPNSFDYTLVYLYLPWGILCVVAFQARRQHLRVPRLTAMFLCFVPLFAPFSLFVWKEQRYGGQIQTVVLLILLWLALTSPIPDDLWRRRQISSAVAA